MTKGYIYFIACEPMNAVKIGFTKSDPSKRMATLQTGCPARLKLMEYVVGSIEDEQKLHKAFAPLWIDGEWFRLEWKLQDFIWYLDHSEGGAATREKFEVALHDVLMQGCWHPDSPITQEQYDETGSWEPFRNELWDAFGPWDEGE